MVVSATRVVAVNPFYGWGWSDSEQKMAPDDIPPPFQATVSQGCEEWFGKAVKTLRGLIDQPNHPLNGFEILMSPRHDPWDGHINVSLADNSGRELVGFGEISLASFE